MMQVKKQPKWKDLMAKVPKISRSFSEKSFYHIQQEEKASNTQIINKAEQEVIQGSQYMDIEQEERFGDVQNKGKERIATQITVYNRSRRRTKSRSGPRSAGNMSDKRSSKTPQSQDYKELE